MSALKYFLMNLKDSSIMDGDFLLVGVLATPLMQ